MIDELNKHFGQFKEVLEVLPTNTKVNVKKKETFIDDEYKANDEKIELIKQEIESRLKKFDSLTINNEISKLEQEIEKCNIVNEWNIYNNSYEKMHLDYYLYQLHRYYKDDLSGVNDCIKKIVQSFSKVNISLTKNDFDFNDSAAIYMDKIINNCSFDELKKCFEEEYWKNSNIIKTIEINFKSIYLRNEKKIDKYYSNRHQEFLKNHKDLEVLEIRKKLFKQLEKYKNQDPYLVFQKFLNNEYSLSDYKEIEIDKKKNMYFEDGSYSKEYLYELYKVLNEYNILIKYKYLFDDMKSRLQSKEGLKNSKSNALKNIIKSENELIKLNSVRDKKTLFGKKKNDDKWLFKYNESLNNVMKLYDEFDNISFDDLIYSKLDQDSTIVDILQLIVSNYMYFVTKTIELDESQDINSINDRYDELRNYVYNEDFILLSNVALLDEKQMKELIVNKYNLENINISIDALLPDNIDKTLNDIKQLITKEDIESSGLLMDDIYLYLEYRKKTK